MISARLYYPIYLIVISILTLFTVRKYSALSVNCTDISQKEGVIPSLLLMILVTAFIAIRPVSGQYFVDMAGYASMWDYWAEDTFRFSFSRQNFLFDNLRAFLSTAGVPVSIFFALISAVYFGTMYVACRRLFPYDTMAAFLVCLAAFSTFSYATNGIKAGSAASIFLLALSFRDKPLISILLAVVSCGFHHSMILVLICYLIVLLVKNPKYYFAIWVVSFFVAAFHFTAFQNFFGAFADEQGQGYLLGEGTAIKRSVFGGFRIDFILYSVVPIIVGWVAVFHKKLKSRGYFVVLNLYTLTNAIWMLCMYAEFTNRIAYLSWFMYPIVLIYPFLKEDWGPNKYRVFKGVAYGHLAFTLFMTFVFYA